MERTNFHNYSSDDRDDVLCSVFPSCLEEVRVKKWCSIHRHRAMFIVKYKKKFYGNESQEGTFSIEPTSCKHTFDDSLWQTIFNVPEEYSSTEEAHTLYSGAGEAVTGR